ncbi:MAG: BMP family ABC transporter substrate-binding protein [Oscillospiraceae bacterium]|nr:BMP family ABC transporter substrate-binding protein [Oscillospiraceae bacterium]
MKKILALALALCMIFALAACGQSAAPAAAPAAEPAAAPAAEPAAEAAADIQVAMITDYGDITDQSFNQTTYEACKAYCESNGLDFTYFKPASDSDEDRVSMIEKAIDEGYNVIVMPGYAFAPAIAATAPDYEDVYFIALDVSEFDLTSAGLETLPANLYSAVYQEELCGYMAGYAAVKLGYTKLGFLGGMAVPAVVRYGYGFVQGADAAAAELGADVSLNYAYGNQFYGDADITAAMDTWYGAGTEVVFACGGGIYSSAAEAAAKVGGKVIGVDVDQSFNIDGQYGEGMTVTSAMKGLGATVNTMLAAVQAGEFANYGGKVENLGLVSEDPELNYVQLPSATTQFGEGFSAEDYVKLVGDMFNGVITVNNDISISAADNATVIAVNDQGNLK